MTAHWGVLDPAEAKGTPAETALAFKDSYRMLHQRIAIFTALPLLCSGFTHVTARRIAQPPRRPLSRGSGPAGYPAEPLVSYRINR
jgi:hypothetical protein